MMIIAILSWSMEMVGFNSIFIVFDSSFNSFDNDFSFLHVWNKLKLKTNILIKLTFYFLVSGKRWTIHNLYTAQ